MLILALAVVLCNLRITVLQQKVDNQGRILKTLAGDDWYKLQNGLVESHYSQ